MPKRDEQLVQRMLEYCDEIAGTLAYFKGDEQRFYGDYIMRNALSMPLQQIGELATHVGDDFIEASGGIPWKQIKGMRTWFAHQYWDMSFDKIWVTLTEDVPDLKGKLEKLLSECRR
ncbi:MAG: DUF86 domain-containing protein [Clostridia bacterium]|nr:DUF86 domain-containing protein [Clostridia bacterium]